MTLYVSNRDGDGKTDEMGHYKFPSSVFSGDVVTPGLLVTQNSPQNMNVIVESGDFRVDSGAGYAYLGWNSTNTVVPISTADPANPRVDSIVLYIDKSAPTAPSPPNNPGVAKIVAVPGIPGAIPTAPNNTTIQTAIDVGNPYIIIANVTVPTGATSIVSANIEDTRQEVTLIDDIVTTDSIEDNAITAAKILTDAISTSKIQNDAVTTAKIVNGAVTSNKLGLTNGTATVLPNQATTSGSFTNLATVGPSITIDVGASGVVLLVWNCRINGTATANSSGVCTFTASGANTIAAADENGLAGSQYNLVKGASCARLLTGLNPGSTTFSLRYRTFGGTASVGFQDRIISAVAL